MLKNIGFELRVKKMASSGTGLKKVYTAPFVVFLLLLLLCQTIADISKGNAHFFLADPKYWIFPLQTLVCSLLLVRYWRLYDLKMPIGTGFTLCMATLVLMVWISPQEVFGATRRFDGFDPTIFGRGTLPYYGNLALRFTRLVVLVPLIEEIFWRGFLLRYLIREDFENVPFGAFSWVSFLIVTAGFCIEHQPVDRPAALVAGALYNLIAYRTRSLSACVLAHAVTNLLLGIYILRTGQWGFW